LKSGDVDSKLGELVAYLFLPEIAVDLCASDFRGGGCEDEWV
jgi:hypothetical protein